MLKTFFDNPILSVATIVTGAVAVINEFLQIIQSPPFWTDVTISLSLLYMAIHWALVTKGALRQSAVPSPIVLTDGAEGEKASIPHAVKAKILVPSSLLILAIGALLSWNISLPLRHVLERRWSLCGSFYAICPKNECLMFYDKRGRPISKVCHRFDDDSGYKELEQPDAWTYRPETVSLVCDGRARPEVKLPAEVFTSPTCDVQVNLE